MSAKVYIGCQILGAHQLIGAIFSQFSEIFAFELHAPLLVSPFCLLRVSTRNLPVKSLFRSRYNHVDTNRSTECVHCKTFCSKTKASLSTILKTNQDKKLLSSGVYPFGALTSPAISLLTCLKIGLQPTKSLNHIRLIFIQSFDVKKSMGPSLIHKVQVGSSITFNFQRGLSII